MSDNTLIIKKKISLLKRWYFWVIIILSITIIVESTLLVISQNNTDEITESTMSPEEKSKDELCKLSRKINTTLGNSNVYFSGDGSLIFIEIRDYKQEYNDTKLKALFEILQSDYCKENFYLATITTYMESGDDTLVSRHIYDIKKQTQFGDNEWYINFDRYSNTVDTFGKYIYGN